MSTRALTFASLFALTACSSQADPTYPGQPLATLQGNAVVVDVDDGTLPPLDVALQWMMPLTEELNRGPTGPSSDGGLLSIPLPTKTTVSGQFPSSFTLQVVAPPPDSVMAVCQNDALQTVPGRYAMAEVLAIQRGMESESQSDDIAQTYVFGAASEFLLAYADSNLSVCEGSIAELADPSTMTKGYHLFRRVVGPCTPDNDEVFSCRSYAEVPLSTVINLPIVPPQFRWAEPLQADGTTPPIYCSDDARLPTDATGNPKCRVILDRYTPDGKPYWGPCDGPGESPADDQTVADATFPGQQQFTTECVVAEVPSAAWVNGSCVDSLMPGWCALPDRATCATPIQLSAGTPDLWPSNGNLNVFSVVCP
jgi:hypothetical protein